MGIIAWIGASAPAATGADDPEVEATATSRVIFFSDAVVAIAITLLALGLPLPNTTGSTTNSQLLHALAGYWDEYLAFIVSFAAIGSHWAAHRRVFRYVTRVNRRVGQLTLVWLLMMVLTPFAARLLAGNGGFGIRFTLYALIQVTASACLVLMSRAVIHADLLSPEAPEAARHPDNVGRITIIVMFALSVPVAFFTSWAFALWAAVPLVTRAMRWHMARTARYRSPRQRAEPGRYGQPGVQPRPDLLQGVGAAAALGPDDHHSASGDTSEA